MSKFAFFAAAVASALVTSALAFAQVPQSEPTLNWESATQTVTISNDQLGQPQNFTLQVPQVMRWTERVPHTEVVCQDVPTEVPGLCQGYRCTDDGHGQSPLWNAYFSAPRAQKPDALANAIKGVGVKSATALVNGGYFNRKPRSWEAFSAEINAAADAKVIVGSVRYQVLVQYRGDNLVNLGYAEGACTPYEYQCLVPGVDRQCAPVTTYTNEPRSKIMQVLNRGFSLVVNNAVLQSFETENFVVTAGYDVHAVSAYASSNAYNHYSFNVQVNGNNGTIVANGTGRNFVKLPEDVNQGAAVVKNSSQVALNVSVNPKYLPDASLTSRGDKLYVSYIVYTCPINWTGTCGFSKYKEAERNEVALEGTDTSIPLHVANKTKVYAKFKFARRGSALYDGGYTTEHETKVLKNSN